MKGLCGICFSSGIELFIDRRTGFPKCSECGNK